MRRFALVEGSSSKFWEIDASGETLTVRFGRLGTHGQTQTKALGSPRAALAERDKLVREKVRKGYVEVADAGAVGEPAPPVGPASTVPTAPAPPERPDPLVGWPAAYTARVIPTRGLRAVTPRRLPWSLVVAQARETQPAVVDATLAELHAEADALLARDDEPASMTPDVAGILFARVVADGFSDPKRRVAALVDACVRVGGLELAIACSLRCGSARIHRQLDGTLRLSAGPSPHGHGTMRPWLRLREHLSSTPEDVYRGALEVAGRCFSAAAGSATSDDARVGLGFAFPGERFAHELALEPGAAFLPRLAAALALSVRGAADAAELLDGLPSSRSALWLDGPDFDATYLTLVAMHGEAIAPALRALGARGMERSGIDALVAAMAMVGAESTFESLLRNATQAPARDVLESAAQRAPEAAARVLARHVGGKDETSRRARTLLAQLVATDVTGRVRQVLAELAPEVQAPVTAAVTAEGTEVGAATADELPEALVAPPWLPGRRPPPRVVDDVVTPALDEVMVEPRQTPQLVGLHGELPGDSDAVRFARLLYRLHVLRDPARIHDLTEDEGLAMLREAARVGRVGPTTLGTGLSRVVRNALLRELPPTTWLPTPQLLRRFVVEEGVEAIDALLHLGRTHLPLVLAAMTTLRSARLAPLAGAGLASKVRSTKDAAERWLGAHPEAAAVGVLAAAVGPADARRTTAGSVLRFLAAAGHGAVVRDVARRAGAADAVDELLADAARFSGPTSCPKLPGFVQPAALPVLILRSGSRLGAAHTETFTRLLALSTLDSPAPEVRVVRDVVTRDSVEAFSWALFQAWLDDGGSPKEAWAFTQLALIGGDRAARDLTPMVRRWPGESAHARAVRGLEILAAIGSDVALMHLHGLSQKGKFKALLERARTLVDEVAARRGLTPSQLGDRLIPHLGLDADGTLALDLGGRSFQVGFDEQLRPFVRGAEGKRLADLPKARADDDPERAAEAHATWKALKKDVRAIASQQIARLETAMVARRRWPVEELRSFVVDHPLLVHLARRVVWGVYAEQGELLTVLRVTEDRSFADENDEAVEVPPGAQVGVVHPVELTAEQLRSLSSLFADYEILQPFDQLGRVVHVVPPGEEHHAVEAWVGRKVPSMRIVALEHRGWRRGEVWDAGIVHSYERAAGDGIWATLGLDPGIAIGAPSMVPEQTVLHLSFGGGGRGGLRIATSEILRDLALLEG